MTYREDLPEGCPRDTAKATQETTIFFRLVDQYPPVEGDFDSVWKLQPRRHQRLRGDECKAKGVSVFDTPEAAQEMTTRHDDLSQKIVCEVNITPDSGPIEEGRSNHYTWWPLRDCKPIDLCSEYKP